MESAHTCYSRHMYMCSVLKHLHGTFSGELKAWCNGVAMLGPQRG